MTSELIHDRGRGPEIIGTRITVYNLLPHFLDPAATESYICGIYDLTVEQVAAARAYVLNHPDTVLREHLRIEERMSAGNSAEVTEQAKQTHAAFVRFREWLAEREQPGGDVTAAPSKPTNGPSGQRLPSFREWLAEQGSSTLKRS